VEQYPSPGRGPGGDVPPPGGPARDGAAAGPRGGLPSGPWDRVPGGSADDWDGDAEMAAFLADIEAGRARVPEPWEIEGPAATISLGDAANVDLAELAAMAGPDGLGGDQFAQGNTADVMRPGPVLAALTEQAAGELGRLTDNQLLGAVSAARRLANRAEYLELAAIAEFARRRNAQFEASKARKDPRGRREGEFADAELAMELVTSVNAARDRIDLAADLAARLPCTFAGLAAGTIDADRAWRIWVHTRFLTDADAAAADKVLAAAAPGLRHDQLARKAAALEMKLDPEAVRRRRDDACRDEQRIETRREHSGNAALAGRELATADAMASKAHIDTLAAALRGGGLEGSLRELRVLVFLDLTQGRDPLQRLTRRCGSQDPDPAADHDESHRDSARNEDDDRHRDGEQQDDEESGEDGYRDEDDGGEGGGPASGPTGPGSPTGGLAPLPALVNLIVPAATLLGWSDAPGEAGAWGLLDSGDTRAIVAAASKHPRTRWCMTVTGPDGTAIAHGCARGQHLWTPAPATSDLSQQTSGTASGPAGPGSPTGGRDGPGTARDGPGSTRDRTPPRPGGHQPPAGPDAAQAVRFIGLLRRLNLTLNPIAKGACDHRHQEHRYTPSRMLQHLIRARTTRCSAPGCGAQAYFCDLDHSIPYPSGITCECGLAPVCRRHHRCKQAPGWQLSQPQPGVMHWRPPSGRVYTTGPTAYDC
jgi:hypothetical protein